MQDLCGSWVNQLSYYLWQMPKDWDKYRGCKIEHSCAVEYGIKVIEYVEG